MSINKIASLPIADLHCDLLCYLSRDPACTPYDLPVRCAIPQLQQGHVKIQTLAVYTQTVAGSSRSGRAQIDIFKRLPKIHPEVFEHLHRPEQLAINPAEKKIGILLAIENASSLFEEDGDLEHDLKLFTKLQHTIGKPAYLSLTWNTENRFGGGAKTAIGLKNDGKRLIEYLCERQIALDLSHTSDHLTYDILNYLDKNNLVLPLLASHSNMRAVIKIPRNLPDELAKEIIVRKGIIGINFIREVDDSPLSFVKHLERILQLGGADHVCFGADFYYSEDLPLAYRKPTGSFFADYGDASCYPKVIDLWRKEMALPEELLANICYGNLVNFMRKNLFTN